VVLKLRSIAPAMVPVAMNGAFGANATVAHRFTCFTYGCWYAMASPAPRRVIRFEMPAASLAHYFQAQDRLDLTGEICQTHRSSPAASTSPGCEGVRETHTPAVTVTVTVKREAMNFLKRGFKAAKSAVGAIFGVRPFLLLLLLWNPVHPVLFFSSRDVSSRDLFTPADLSLCRRMRTVAIPTAAAAAVSGRTSARWWCTDRRTR